MKKNTDGFFLTSYGFFCEDNKCKDNKGVENDHSKLETTRKIEKINFTIIKYLVGKILKLGSLKMLEGKL